jgi:predicted amidohydrolase
MPETNLKIAVAQLNNRVGDIAVNVRKIRRAHLEADEGGADLLVTPELSLTGYPLNVSLVANVVLLILLAAALAYAGK